MVLFKFLFFVSLLFDCGLSSAMLIADVIIGLKYKNTLMPWYLQINDKLFLICCPKDSCGDNQYFMKKAFTDCEGFFRYFTINYATFKFK